MGSRLHVGGESVPCLALKSGPLPRDAMTELMPEVLVSRAEVGEELSSHRAPGHPLSLEKARAGKLTPDEMTGSTFTISNMGMLNVENFTAIINPGESAILDVSRTVKKAVVRDDKVVVRSIMKMTLSSDHRIIDGALAARFANAIKQKLEDIELWKRLTV